MVCFVAEKFWLPSATSCRKFDIYLSRNDGTFDTPEYQRELKMMTVGFLQKRTVISREMDLWLYD